MSVRRLVASLGVTAVAVAVSVLPAAASYAVATTDAFVVTPANGGDDAHDCSVANPCATVARAIFAADASGTTIHVGAGTFDGELRPAALGKSVSIVGDGSATTTLTADSSGNGFVLEVGDGTTALSSLTINGGLFTDVLVDGGAVTTDHVVLSDSGCNLVVESGSATLTDSTVQNGGSPGGCITSTPSAEISQTGGSISVVRTLVRNASVGVAGVSMTGGTFTADQSFFDDSDQVFDTNESSGVEVTGGTATVTRSTFHGWASVAVDVAGGSALISDSTFQTNVVGVDVGSGSATVVRSTFQHELASLQGSVSVVGSVLGSRVADPAFGIVECNPNGGTITDLGYNLSTDATCGFSGTSHDSVAGLDLDTALADRGGPVPTVATLQPSSAVDSIPADATYGVSATPLCAGTDLRGVPRPQAGACDAGSMELAATTTSLQAPATAKPHADVTLDATVAVPDVGVGGIELPVGTVSFQAGTTVLCQDVPVHLGQAACTTSAIPAGSQSLQATFTPTDGTTLHGSASTSRAIKVGTVPSFTSPSRATFVVGKSRTFRVRASGSPTARITLVKGKLPAGLSFHAGNGSATISGKAKASGVGSRSVTVQAANLRGTVRQVLRIAVARH